MNSEKKIIGFFLFSLLLFGFLSSRTEVIKTKTIDPDTVNFFSNLTLAYPGHVLKINPLVSYQGVVSSLADRVTYNNQITKNGKAYKWGIKVPTISAAVANRIDWVALDIMTDGKTDVLPPIEYDRIEATGNLTPGRETLNRRYDYQMVFEDGVTLSLNDLVKSGFQIDIVNSTRVLITNITANIKLNSLNFDPQIITTCGVISLNDTQYILSADVDSDSDCYYVYAWNSSIDLMGHTITFSNSWAGSAFIVYPYPLAYNFTISNGTITDGAGDSYETGILLNKVNKTTLDGITLTMSSIAANDIQAINSSNVTIDSSLIYGCGVSNWGVYLINSNDTIIRDTTVIVGCTGNDNGIDVYSVDSKNVTVQNSRLQGEGISNPTGIWTSRDSYNLLNTNLTYGYGAGQWYGIEGFYGSRIQADNTYFESNTEGATAVRLDNSTVSFNNTRIIGHGITSSGFYLVKSTAAINNYTGIFDDMDYPIIMFSGVSLDADNIQITALPSGSGGEGAFFQSVKVELTNSIWNIYSATLDAFNINYIFDNSLMDNVTIYQNNSASVVLGLLRVNNLLVRNSNITSTNTKPAISFGDAVSTNETFQNSFISAPNNETIFTNTGTNTVNVSFINVTFNLNKTYWLPASKANLSVYFYLKAKSLRADTGANLSSSTAIIKNNAGTTVYSQTTDANGLTPWNLLFDGVYSSSGKIVNAENYSLNFTKGGFSENYSLVNMSSRSQYVERYLTPAMNITITSPYGQTSFNSSLNLSVTTSVIAANCSYQINSGSQVGLTSIAGVTWWSNITVPEGNNTITATCIDNYNNVFQAVAYYSFKTGIDVWYFAFLALFAIAFIFLGEWQRSPYITGVGAILLMIVGYIILNGSLTQTVTISGYALKTSSLCINTLNANGTINASTCTYAYQTVAPQITTAQATWFDNEQFRIFIGVALPVIAVFLIIAAYFRRNVKTVVSDE